MLYSTIFNTVVLYKVRLILVGAARNTVASPRTCIFMLYSIYTDAWYRYHRIGKESLPQIKVQIVAHICFLEIKYSSPLRVRKCSYHSHGLFIDLRFNSAVSGMISLILRGWLTPKEVVSSACAVHTGWEGFLAVQSWGRTKNLGVCFAVESLLCQSGALFVPLCLNVLQSHPGSAPP